MTDDELINEVFHQSYPLSISQDAAMAIAECIQKVMEMVPEDDAVLVRAEYNLATSALVHPVKSD